MADNVVVKNFISAGHGTLLKTQVHITASDDEGVRSFTFVAKYLNGRLFTGGGRSNTFDVVDYANGVMTVKAPTKWNAHDASIEVTFSDKQDGAAQEELSYSITQNGVVVESDSSLRPGGWVTIQDVP